MIDDAVPTKSSKDLDEVEANVAYLYRNFFKYARSSVRDESNIPTLDKEAHATFLLEGLGKLPEGYTSLDASRPWVAFWACHGLNLLGSGHQIPQEAVISMLSTCQYPSGGFGGGPHQIPHLAPTYAAVAALVSLCSDRALLVIDRDAIATFLDSMCVPPGKGGGMTVHAGGERDIRAAYLALATAHMLNLDTTRLAQRADLVGYICRCQTFEGGLGGEPGNEAHGGYTYCGLAALALVGYQRSLDLTRLLAWAAQQQRWMEGGFAGRTNKLPDGCYSFWQGGLFPLLQASALSGHRAIPREAVLRSSAQAVRVDPLPAELLEPRGFCGAAMNDDSFPTVAHGMRGERTDARDAGCTHEGHVRCSASTAVLPQGTAAHSLLQQLSETRSCGDAATTRAAVRGAALGETGADREGRSVGSTCKPGPDEGPPAAELYDGLALQFWLMVACQEDGGLRDKPGKWPDFYHTCYGLSGLSSAQEHSGAVLGGRGNALLQTDAMTNVLPDALMRAREFFS